MIQLKTKSLSIC